MCSIMSMPTKLPWVLMKIESWGAILPVHQKHIHTAEMGKAFRLEAKKHASKFTEILLFNIKLYYQHWGVNI